jgi:hypothetical protein
MNRQVKIYLLAVDAEERRILMRLPDGALSGVEKVKNVFGKEARVLAYTETQSHPASSSGQKRA